MAYAKPSKKGAAAKKAAKKPGFVPFGKKPAPKKPKGK